MVKVGRRRSFTIKQTVAGARLTDEEYKLGEIALVVLIAKSIVGEKIRFSVQPRGAVEEGRIHASGHHSIQLEESV